MSEFEPMGLDSLHRIAPGFAKLVATSTYTPIGEAQMMNDMGSSLHEDSDEIAIHILMSSLLTR